VGKLILGLFTLFFTSCGTTGHIVFYNFDASKYEVEKEIDNVLKTDSTYLVPSKWKEHTKGDYFERMYLYFKNNPEELYQIGFTYDSTVWKHSPTSRLGLIAIYQGNKFQYESDLSIKEIERITKRFETEILSKIKYPYFKSD
jgi:hypothetical protein